MDPTSADYERCLIAGCRRKPALIDELRIGLGDFTDPKAAVVFSAIDSVRLSGRELDDVTLWQAVAGRVDSAYLATLPEAAVHNAPWYLEQVRSAALRRRIKAAALSISEIASRQDMESPEILEAIDQELTALGSTERSELVWLKDVLKLAVDDIQRRAANRDLVITGITSGYQALDQITDGFQPGDLIIVGARPSIGKTSLAVSILVNAIRKDVRCGFFSCEMSEVLIAQRFLANAGRFNLGAVRRGTIGLADASRMLQAAEELYHDQLLLNATPNIKLVDLKALARTMVRRGARLVVVDYLTLIQHGDPRTPRHERVGEVSKQLKGIARELNIPVIALSQLTRTAEGQEPNLADLRQSGEIEEDSDLVLLMHRERDKHEGPTALIVAKNRNGPCARIELDFKAAFCRFDEPIPGANA